MSVFNGEFFEVTEAKYVTWGHRKFGLLKLRRGTKRGSSTRKQIVSHTLQALSEDGQVFFSLVAIK